VASLVQCRWPIPTRLVILLNRQQPSGCVLAKCSVSGLGPAFGSPGLAFPRAGRDSGRPCRRSRHRARGGLGTSALSMLAVSGRTPDVAAMRSILFTATLSFQRTSSNLESERLPIRRFFECTLDLIRLAGNVISTRSTGGGLDERNQGGAGPP
jgi:hypothetical protein